MQTNLCYNRGVSKSGNFVIKFMTNTLRDLVFNFIFKMMLEPGLHDAVFADYPIPYIGLPVNCLVGLIWISSLWSNLYMNFQNIQG